MKFKKQKVDTPWLPSADLNDLTEPNPLYLACQHPPYVASMGDSLWSEGKVSQWEWGMHSDGDRGPDTNA